MPKQDHNSHSVDARHYIRNLLQRRRSPRAFSSRPISLEDLQTILEAARWAPSSANEQPWRYMVARHEDKPEHDKMVSLLAEGNRIWANRAPVLILTMARRHFEKYKTGNLHALHDVGLASACMMLQALDLDIYMRQMGGFDMQRSIEAYAIPPDYEPVSIIALGYPGHPAQLPDHLAQREQQPRSRRPLSEIVFSGRFGTSANWLTDSPDQPDPPDAHE